MNAVKEKLLYETYQKLLDLAFNNKLEIDNIDDLVVEDVMGYGTTVDEKIFAKSGVRELIRRQREQSKNIDMLLNYTPVYRRISADENTAVIADDIFMSINLNNETVEMYVRFSVVFVYEHNKWLVVHFHASKPENVKSEKDTFGIEEWKQQNEKLQRLVDEKTAELEQKNNALIVEVSLEKVRGVAMGMSKPNDLLLICEVFFNELVALGFKHIRNALIHIFNDKKGYYYDYDYSDFTGGKITHLPYKGNARVENFLEQIRKSEDAFVEIVFDGKELEEWKNFRESSGQLYDERINTATQLNYYFYSIGAGNIGLSTFEKITKDQLEILKRFRNVFDFSYRRYLDIAKAEAQAREAQIELALERIRARTMAMQRSDELPETSFLLFNQFRELGENAEQISIGIMNEEEHVLELSATLHGNRLQQTLKLKIDESAVQKKIYNAWKQQKKSIVIDIAGKDLQAYNIYRNNLSGYKGPKFDEDDQTHWIIHVAFFSKGMLSFSSHEPHPPETIQLLERFAQVFDQTYTRFLDLQKAETQAREAQIETAVERVRGKALAMQKSEDLHSVVVALKKALMGLNIRGVTAVSMYLEQDDGSIRGLDLSTPTDGEEEGYAFKMDVVFRLEDTYPDLWIRRIWNGTEKYFVVEADEADFKRMIKWLYTLDEKEAAVAERIIKEEGIKKAWLPTVKLEKGKLNIDLLEPPGQEIESILIKIGAAFDLAYKRFLDLQKAEAQAREAKIEASLERVRASAMAMHSSEGLLSVTQVLREQMAILGERKLESILIHIYNTVTDDFEAWYSYRNPEDPNGKIADGKVILDWSNTARAKMDKAMYHSAQSDYTIVADQKMLTEWYNYLQKIVPKVVEHDNQGNILVPDVLYYNYSKFAGGALLLITNNEASVNSKNLLKRSAKVFNLAYTRFIDLQNTEAQVREAHIEAALERVRSRTMAMHKSDELQEVSKIIIQQIVFLNLPLFGFGIHICHENEPVSKAWIGDPTKGQVPTVLYEHTHDSLSKLMYKGWKDGESLLVKKVEGEELKEHFKYMVSITPISSIFETATAPEFIIYHFAYFSHGFFVIAMLSPYEEAQTILKRFAKVFEQTYTRFLDLQKAEAQAREAQIEASLERIRSRTMGMQKSNELLDVAVVLYKELVTLGVSGFATCGYVEVEEKNNMQHCWMTNPDGSSLETFSLPLIGDEVFDERYAAWKNKDIVFHQSVAADKLAKHLEFAITAFGSKEAEEMVKTKFPDPTIFYCSNFSQGYLHLITGTLLDKDAELLMARFTRVFEQTYARFLDLKKAEAQAREATIEAALERVRSRTMAMQRSEEIAVILGKIFEELKLLDVVLNRILIWIFNGEKKYIEWWSANSELETNAESYRIDYNQQLVFLTYFEAWQKKTPLLLYTISGDTKASWENFLFSSTGLSKLPTPVKEGMRAEGTIFTTSVIDDYGLLMSGSLEPLSDANIDIIQRFGRVFQQAYTRYLDVQKAEAQAREATIEAALEKVRGKAIAMHNSNDLSVTASMVFTELRKLGINSIRSGVGLLTKENRKVSLYAATSSEEGDHLSLVGWAMLQDHEVLSEIYDSWVRDKDYFPVLKGELLKGYYEKIKSNFVVPQQQAEYEQHGYFLPFSEGVLYGWSEKPFAETEIKILKRFASVIDLTFRRYIELQKSEANAREAVKQAALDRVRAEIASMRTVSDLEKITPLIWNELNILGIPFIRCGVFIMDEAQQFIHTFLSTPDGKAIAAFHVPYNTPGNISLILSNWKQKEKYIDHWDEAAFDEFAGALVKQGALASSEQYLKTLPKGGFYLHFLPFLQGMLYVGNTTELSEDEIKLIQSVADAFSTAYARYEDFNKLEAAKQQVDKTLVDLKQAQTQLIQSEKMASLGELTAGIAHEIQNPLNFVNNFSEVNTELIDELKTELATGNTQQAIELANDIKDNEQKINHHGKRADAIVKGMLQHSRASTDKKELTDINALADEYMRLSYHGLRAKDKSLSAGQAGFNATFTTDFDNSIGKININPQDIGRVILNLLTNAFYVVNERKRQQPDGYEPTVSIQTKKINDKVEIKVSDNGNGIPQKVLDKIFQPFFTTKPTGQGTGLGLSLSYDIIKAHGGEIIVETKEGEGTTFILKIPTA